MKRLAFLVAACTAVLTLVLPFVGGSGPSLTETSAQASSSQQSGLPIFASLPRTADRVSAPVQVTNQSEAVLAASSKTRAAELTQDSEHMAQKPVPKPVVVVAVPGTKGNSGGAARRAAVEAAGGTCPSAIGGSTGGAPGATSAGGVSGTTSADLASFAANFNAIRVANCLQPSRGCDGNLAGGSGNSGATVATKWWNSLSHRASLYKPTFSGNTAGVCIYFAMTHGGLPNEDYSFTRAAAKWGGC